MSNHVSDADDLLVHQTAAPITRPASRDAAWFDRFYFNAHDDGNVILVIGGAVYPNTGVIDGYACLGRAGEQRNLRFAGRTPAATRLLSCIGPLSWSVLTPLESWLLDLGTNPSGMTFSLRWHAAQPPFMVDPIRIEHQNGPETNYAHFFQPGHHRGHLTVDGQQYVVSDWAGQRDRSWGVRRARDRLGLHLWIAAHFEWGSIGLNYNEDRSGSPVNFDGTVHRDGKATRATALEHNITLDESGSAVAAQIRLVLEDGDTLEFGATGQDALIHMAGAGYDGRHGAPPQSPNGEMAAERWDLTDHKLISELPLRLVDRVCTFDCQGTSGNGIVETGRTRSSAYAYSPTFTETP
jgi:hypothetical protein